MRVVGLGQRGAGDDAVGLEIVDELRRGSAVPSASIHSLAETTDLLPLLEDGEPILLVDAVVAEPVGRVVALEARDLAATGKRPASTHGLGVVEVLALARALAGERPLPLLSIVAVTIPPPRPFSVGLSPRVAAAVPEAVRLVRERLEAEECTKPQ